MSQRLTICLKKKKTENFRRLLISNATSKALVAMLIQVKLFLHSITAASIADKRAAEAPVEQSNLIPFAAAPLVLRMELLEVKGIHLSSSSLR